MWEVPNCLPTQFVKSMHKTSNKFLCQILFFVLLRFFCLGSGRKAKTLAKRYVSHVCRCSVTHPMFFCIFLKHMHTRPDHGSPRHNRGTDQANDREAGFHVLPRRVSCSPSCISSLLFIAAPQPRNPAISCQLPRCPVGNLFAAVDFCIPRYLTYFFLSCFA